MTTKAGIIGAPRARRAQPPAIAASPPGIGRGTRRDASEPAMTARFRGAKRRPSALWACRTARNIAGEVVPVIASATSEPRARPGRLKDPRGTSGFAARRWMRRKRTSRRTPPATGSTIVRLSPKRIAARPSVRVSAPGTSRPPLPPPSERGSREPASTAPARHGGTLTANTHSQPGPLLISPPSTQPDAPPPAAAAVQMASARERTGPAGSVATSSASADGATSAAPVPWTARAATSAAADGAHAHATEAAEKTSRPARKARRRPYRSATRPASSSPPPNVSVYALITH
jgi:hypothetical protein